MSKIFERQPREEDKFNLKKDSEEIATTSRRLADYMDMLKLAEDEFDNPDSLILDLGSGIEQNLAKDIRQRGLKSKIISLDPKLGLSDEEDLSGIGQDLDKEIRMKARKNAESGTVAGLSNELPFSDNVFKRIYAIYSAPYYLNHPEDIKKTLREMIRVLKPGGIVKAFPIEEEQVEVLQSLLESSDNINFSIKRIATKTDYGNLLTINKK